ncbi:ketoacyl-ACP synthase III family protein [Vibrio ruber]|uniref:3-oxoacyl-ACP synthase III family protein n=1 Tax=Vibrio ruber TaxID=184755 RepID=UPI0028933E95|nr:ketoacyl-ACP synthase III family protein [Vibrio ruber]WNJ94734.1 ketoacyl-ACP synthase III family protein [Vibrio ruber]
MYLESVTTYIPENQLVVEEDYQRLGLTYNEARVFSRMYELPVCPVEDGAESDMLFKPCFELLAKSPGLREQIGIIIYAHTGAVSGSWGKNTANFLARRLKLSKAIALGTCSNNCIAIFSAMNLANTYLQHHCPDKKALVVVGEMADNIELRVVANVAVVGDASAAVVLSPHGEGFQVISHSIHTYGGYSEGIWLATTSDAYRDFERHYQERLKSVIEDTLRQSGLQLDDLNYVVPHNVNIWMWRRAAEYIGISLDKLFLDNIRKTAHCLGADMLINFHDLCASRTMQSGDLVMLVSAGVGGVFGAALIRI